MAPSSILLRSLALCTDLHLPHPSTQPHPSQHNTNTLIGLLIKLYPRILSSSSGNPSSNPISSPLSVSLWKHQRRIHRPPTHHLPLRYPSWLMMRKSRGRVKKLPALLTVLNQTLL